jgi:hypothetical protein
MLGNDNCLLTGIGSIQRTAYVPSKAGWQNLSAAYRHCGELRHALVRFVGFFVPNDGNIALAADSISAFRAHIAIRRST